MACPYITLFHIFCSKLQIVKRPTALLKIDIAHGVKLPRPIRSPLQSLQEFSRVSQILFQDVPSLLFLMRTLGAR